MEIKQWKGQSSCPQFRTKARVHHSLISWKLILAFVFILHAVNAKAEYSLPASNSSDTDSNQSKQSRSSSSCGSKIITNLRVVTCKNYNIIPTDIENSQEVSELNMNDNGNTIQTLTSGQLARAALPQLKKLYLQNCQVFRIERGAFEEGKVLTELDLRKNRIEVLDSEVFTGLNNLKTLHLSENPIHRFQTGAVFSSDLLIEKLYLKGCQLDDIPENAFDNLKRLSNLDLENNKLETLNWRVFRNMGTLRNLYIGGNPWRCDCRVKFLIEILVEKGLTFPQATCAVGDHIDLKWDSVFNDLTCLPVISKFEYSSYDVTTHTNAVNQDNREARLTTAEERGHVNEGQDVYFECNYTGYPEPEVLWFKDGLLIKLNTSQADPPSRGTPKVKTNEVGDTSIASDNNSGDSYTSPPVMRETENPRLSVRKNTDKTLNPMANDEKISNDKFTELLILRKVQLEDRGKYECFVKNAAGGASKAVDLNMTVPHDDGLAIGGLGGGRKAMAVWMWILIGLLCLLILVVILLLTLLIWRRRDKVKQEGFRQVMHDKFKDSNIDIGELIDMKKTPTQHQKESYPGTNRSEGTTPLLDNKSENSTIVMSMIADQNQMPDITLGNADLIRNSHIFSPKPPLALNGYSGPMDARKEFFARQISEPYLRPGSAMSLSRPAALNVAQRRYIYANQEYQSTPTFAGQEPQYAVPGQVHMLPRSGSAMSMSTLPADDLRRQLFLRQYSQPSYATASRISRRTPSISSEPPQDMGAYNYSTLPRRPIRVQNWSRPGSPTDSTCSSYSTLSWRPGMNPVTGIIYDGAGPRTTADGGSTLSLNKIADSNGNISQTDVIDSMNRGMITPSNGGKVMKNGRNPRTAHSRTPSSLTRGHNDFFSFEPIQEVESSECASTLNLDTVSGQTPSGHATQSLPRQEARYKKRKPPPISMLPAKLKEPSRAFDHLKGKSASPAQRNNKENNTNKNEVNNTNEVNTSIPDINNTVDNNGNMPILESPIDEDDRAQLSTKAPPPAPPPKPKRNQTPEFDKSSDSLNVTAETSEEKLPATVADGTVV